MGGKRHADGFKIEVTIFARHDIGSPATPCQMIFRHPRHWGTPDQISHFNISSRRVLLDTLSVVRG